ncbi:MAG: tRNA (N6-isopentenyl adenosine(37)-C2)-methylthiotransferase MiaB [Gammaproteobacteria bacterium]|nr:tRNA (N6-isopentenyl adenosine(37)-C2)-methylthiotransferase MiaB [Gammaproteobacteria bacterium]
MSQTEAPKSLSTDKPENKKLFIKTWGCQMNEYDSGKMADLLKSTHGYEITDKAEEADVLLLNTCSIREKAQDKVFSQLGEWRELKAAKPGVVIGVGGCVASQEGEAIRKRMPLVDMVFGPQTLHRLPEMLNTVTQERSPVVDVSFPEIEKFDRLPEPTAEGPTAFVSIMEGCNKYCSFCVVPYTRGEEISRPFDDVIAEIAVLAAQDVKEVTLLGQNVNAYRGLKHDGEICDFAELLYFVAEIEGLERIRYTTSHPIEFNDRIIQAYADIPKLVNHLHLPVQSGSDRVLAAMKRNHTILEYKSKVRKLMAVRPDMRLSTDIIVGFPGETDADFEATMKLVEEVRYDQSFSFIYSSRPGTPAADLPDDLPLETKKQRLAILQGRINQFAQEYARRLVGTVQRVLVTGVSRKNVLEIQGRTECNRIVNFAGAHTLIGGFAEVRVTEALPNSLRGELV